MFIFITVLMTKTRLGMIIRAGVQDPQMVEALGINVEIRFYHGIRSGDRYGGIGWDWFRSLPADPADYG